MHNSHKLENPSKIFQVVVLHSNFIEISNFFQFSSGINDFHEITTLSMVKTYLQVDFESFHWIS